MAVSDNHERGINNSPTPAQFLEEEHLRGRLGNGALTYPRPHFVQPDNGAHTQVGGGLDIQYNIAARRMKVGNDTTDLDAGYYPGGHS